MKNLLFIFLPLFVMGQTYTVTDRNIGSSTYGESRQYEVESNGSGGIQDNLNYESIGKASSPTPVDYGKAFQEGYNNATKSSNNSSSPASSASAMKVA